MLTDKERATALKIMLSSHDPEEFAADDRLCREFPTITTDDLVMLWREAVERQLAEAGELEKLSLPTNLANARRRPQPLRRAPAPAP